MLSWWHGRQSATGGPVTPTMFDVVHYNPALALKYQAPQNSPATKFPPSLTAHSSLHSILSFYVPSRSVCRWFFLGASCLCCVSRGFSPPVPLLKSTVRYSSRYSSFHSARNSWDDPLFPCRKGYLWCGQGGREMESDWMG